MYDVTAPGGKTCIVDVDDTWRTTYPDVPAFTALREAAIDAQKLGGGDRNVGRTLATRMAEVGFVDTTIELVPLTSKDLGMQNFLDITTGFKRELLQNQAGVDPDVWLKEIYQVCDDPHA